jgi:hypothetical protein
MPQQANSTVGLMGKAAKDSGMSMLATTDPGNNYNNGVLDPYIALNACTIIAVTARWGQCSVAQATVGANPVIQLGVYRNDATSRTSLGTISIPVVAGNCGVSNNLGGNNFATASVTGLSIAIAQGDAWGIQFTNLGANNNQINALGRCFVVVEVQE